MQSTTEKITIRGLQHHIYTWGDPQLPTLFALHGWMDCGSSFTYIAAELSKKFHIIAPDLRGFGDTEHPQQGYWFPDYLADLDELIDHYSSTEKVNLLGHSMGGNIALMYAGICPGRVANVLSLDALGLQQTTADDTPKKHHQWLQQVNRAKQKKQKTYADLNAFQQVIQANHPTLINEVTLALANCWSKPLNNTHPSTERILKHDRKHLHTNPYRYNHDEIVSIWRQVTARVGLIMAENSSMYKKYLSSGRIDDAMQVLNIIEENYYIIKDSQHMLHLEQPVATAKYIQHFFN